MSWSIPRVHPAPGFSHVAIAEGTRVVHFAGQLGLNPDFARGRRSARSDRRRDAEPQARDGRYRVGWDDVVRRTIYTIDPTAYEVITQAIDEVTGELRTRRRRSSGSPASPSRAA